MKLHLTSDYLVSAFFAVSPWLFGFSHAPANIWVPFLVIGVAVFIVSLMTQTQPRGLMAQSRTSS
ncbi:MAG: hypothetical protein JWR26_4428 [Pedosphaera sp.]|nr:hypothetical protein [Pedosphaera sp.]